MKKKFEAPNIEVIIFNAQDVIITSGEVDNDPNTGSNQTPWG